MTTEDKLPPHELETPEDDGARKMPYSSWWPLFVGAIAGLAMRLVYSGEPGGSFSAMSAGFVYLAPLLVGAVTVFAAERQMPRTWGYYFRAGAMANLLFVVGTMLALIEGLICAVVIVPLFMLIGGFAGLLMGFVCRKLIWPRTTLYSLAALPLVLSVLTAAAPVPPPQRVDRIERSIVIAAPPAIVWQQIHDARDIQPAEVQQGWMYRIGVPLPQSGVTRETDHGRVREITMGKQIRFEQVEQERHENRHVRWRYRFGKDSIPAGALDDHVAIGGHYFDLIDTAYTLAPVADGSATRLSIDMGYRVSTDFNWYARPVASLLIGNFEDVILKFYARRAERSAH